VKHAAQEWKEAKLDTADVKAPHLFRESSEVRMVPEFKEITVVEELQPWPASNTAAEHEVRVVMWIMRRLKQTIQIGGFLTPSLFIPKDVWHQDIVKISSFQLKINSCQELRHRIKELKAKEQSFVNEPDRALEALSILEQAVEGIQSGMVFQVSGVQEEEQWAGKEGLDKVKTISYSLAKKASSIAHGAVDVTKLTPEQNRAYLSLLTAIFDEAQCLEETLLAVATQVPSAPSTSLNSTLLHPASVPVTTTEPQQPDTVHPAFLFETSTTPTFPSATTTADAAVTIHTETSGEVSGSASSSADLPSSEAPALQRSPSASESDLMRKVVVVTRLLSRTVLRFVMDDLLSRLKQFHATQVHLFVDPFE